MANEAKDFADDTLGIDDSGGLGGTAKEFVENPIGKIEDAVKGTVEGISDAGSWLDDYVLQPMIDDPITTIATVAAISTGNAYLVPYINAASTAAKGGDLEQIGKSFVASYAGGQAANWVGPQVSAATQGMNQATSNIIRGTVSGATRGATTAAIAGGDIKQGALIGGATGGVSSAWQEFTAPTEQTIVATDAKNLAESTNNDTAAIQQNLIASGVDPLEAASAAQDAASGKNVSTIAKNLSPSADLYTATPAEQQQYAGVTTGGEGLTEQEQAQLQTDIAASTATPGDQTTLDYKAVGDWFAKKAVGALGNQMLARLLNLPDIGDLEAWLNRLKTPTLPVAPGGGSDATAAQPGQVTQEKYELRNFVNDQGGKMSIPFKDDQPQQPIPAGYYEDTGQGLQAAKGGLASKKAKSVVKSKKGLAAKK